LLTGLFALPDHSQRSCRRRIQNWLTFFCEAQTEIIVPDDCAERTERPVEFTGLRQNVPGAAAEFAAFKINLKQKRREAWAPRRLLVRFDLRIAGHQPLLNRDRMICGDWFAIDKACTPSCCLTCKDCNIALSVAISASTRLPIPVVRLSDNSVTNVP
jgi:hypothetical protein